MLTHAAINIKGRKSTVLAANTTSEEMPEGIYDVYAASALTYLKVADNPTSTSSGEDYPIPSGATVPVYIPDKCKVRASSQIILFKVD